MNERIDELMVQAGAKFEFLHSVHYDDFQYRKFAELIIRECGKSCTLPGDEEDMFRKFGIEHFGVE